MLKHKVVLIPFPFDDLSSTKVRPAVCLTESIGAHNHVVLAFVTSRIPQSLLSTDIVIDAQSPEFATTGLRVSSTLQLHRLITLTTSLIQRELGMLSPSLQVEVETHLKQLFDL